MSAQRVLPQLSRFELQCLRRFWIRGQATVREVEADFPRGPSYSTFRKIIERLEAKGAVARVRREGRAWVYRSTVSSTRMIRHEIRRLINGLFDGQGAALVAHLADMDAISLEELRVLEERVRGGAGERRRSAQEAASRQAREKSEGKEVTDRSEGSEKTGGGIRS